jgi:peptidyl-prolyl cis-trans isomerase C
MKLLIPLIFFATLAAAQDPAAVSINGKTYTRAEFEAMVQNVGGNIPAQFNSNREGFLEMLGLTQRFAEEAKRLKVHEMEPYASRMAYNEMIQLAQYVLDVKSREFRVMPGEQEAYYEKNKQRYATARVKVLYLSFLNTAVLGAGPARNEEETKALVAKIQARLKSGTDFVALVREYSDDADSKAKDGDFSELSASDTSLPVEVTKAIFDLKPGQVTEPIRQANGYYLFRLEEMKTKPFEEVRDDIYMDLQKEALDAWVGGIRETVKVEVKDPSFLQAPAQP